MSGWQLNVLVPVSQVDEGKVMAGDRQEGTIVLRSDLNPLSKAANLYRESSTLLSFREVLFHLCTTTLSITPGDCQVNSAQVKLPGDD
jgi:hypothetical protein